MSVFVPLGAGSLHWQGQIVTKRAGHEGVRYDQTMGIGVAAHLFAVPLADPGSGHASGDLVPRVLATLGHFAGRVVSVFDPSIEPVPPVRDLAGEPVFVPWAIGVGAALLVAFAALAWLAWRRAGLRPYLADALWLLVPLAPVSNLWSLQGGTLVADRYLYLPMLGVGALLARAALPRRPSGSPSGRGGGRSGSSRASASTPAPRRRSDRGAPPPPRIDRGSACSPWDSR